MTSTHTRHDKSGEGAGWTGWPAADPTAPIRTTIWIYFWLLLLEGALRKWVFPSQSDLIFVIRDPVALLAYVLALRAGLFPFRMAILSLAIMAMLSLAFSLANDVPMAVILFGLRTDFFHLPLIFIMQQVMNRSDVIRLGRWFLFTSIPILILMIRQFDSAPEAWVNVGAGGNEIGQIRGAMGKIRPPGPFSFISGTVVYYSMVAAFVSYGWLHSRTYSRALLITATAAVALAVPISISRSLLLGVLIVAAFGLAASLRDVRRIPGYIGPLLAILAFIVLAGDTIYVQAFAQRWQESIEAGQGGFYRNVVGRLLGMFTEPFAMAAGVPLFGHGIGMGTIGGARLMRGEYLFLLAESELTRNVLELGPVLGFVFILWRLWLTLTLVFSSWRTFLWDGDALAWLITGASFITILNGQWGQATQLGFAVFGAGLAFAAMNPPEEAGESEFLEDGAVAENLAEVKHPRSKLRGI